MSNITVISYKCTHSNIPPRVIIIYSKILNFDVSLFISQKIPDNQCGGYGQTNGFGQSPVVLSTNLFWQCHTDLSGYELFQGTCNWSDLQFEVTKHGEMFNSETNIML